ncbi:alpha-amylase family glycosyl hydrolase [Aureitalea sp. L0-47]|uniref:alpha-amylase family glycosyl hydrolase n=1 Tax=Aureitalea sp. L0-47 TaxID=2816962 RepID=UPI00223903FC|nr:alpha-amylase family glycosyl hydrolase [Aureitalea sp. L0-47]
MEIENSTEIAPITDAVLESAIIYEANIRQYSPEGTFEAFTRDIPKLKELGVKVIWLMPIFPISEAKRKATQELMVEDIQDPKEREKYLGSYYAVANFREINPEFGTIDDFRALLQTAHDNDIYVILDWVPNHTGWDHVWITEHPDFYTKNAQGEITDPLNDDGTPVGWNDVADLDYSNQALHRAMIDDMKYWVKEEGIDGFRCDMAGMVPTEFWSKAIPELRAEKDIFMLAEWDNPELTQNNLFEMAYGWETHHLLNAIAKGEKNVQDLDNHMNHLAEKWRGGGFLMNFLTNHDENSWAGTVRERMGDASEAMLALTYCLPGMPLVYSGQEYDLDHRLKFFEKDSIPKEKGTMWPLMEKLGSIKNNEPALSGAKEPGSYTRLSTNSEMVFAFKREKNDNALVFVANLSGKDATFTLQVEGDYKELLSEVTLSMAPGKSMELGPWQFMILRKTN